MSPLTGLALWSTASFPRLERHSPQARGCRPDLSGLRAREPRYLRTYRPEPRRPSLRPQSQPLIARHRLLTSIATISVTLSRVELFLGPCPFQFNTLSFEALGETARIRNAAVSS